MASHPANAETLPSEISHSWCCLRQIHWYPCWKSVIVWVPSVSCSPVCYYWFRRKTDQKTCDMCCKMEIPVFKPNCNESPDSAFLQISFIVFSHPTKAISHCLVHANGKISFWVFIIKMNCQCLWRCCHSTITMLLVWHHRNKNCLGVKLQCHQVQQGFFCWQQWQVFCPVLT